MAGVTSCGIGLSLSLICQVTSEELSNTTYPVHSARAPEKKKKKKKKSVRIHALGSQIHPLNFNSVREMYSLKSGVRHENTP